MAKQEQESRKLFDVKGNLKGQLRRSLYGLVQPGLEKLLGIQKLNKLYARISEQDLGLEGFSAEVLKSIGVEYELPEEDFERLRQVEGPLVLVCNHPFGVMEALLVLIINSRIRDDFRVMANFMLQQVEEVKDHLVLVDPFEQEDSSRKNMAPLKEALQYLKNGGMMTVFPSGEVASYSLRTGKIEEPEWNTNISKLILKTGAAVVPIYFHGTNSPLFHAAGLLNPKLRTSLLIREFVRPSQKQLRYTIGDVIPPKRVQQYSEPDQLTRYIRSKTYLLGLRYPSRHIGIRLKRRRRRNHTQRQAPVVARVEQSILDTEVEALRNKGAKLLEQRDFEVLLFSAEEAPYLLRELGRQREITFRAVGEGTGEPIDISDYDMYYQHIVIWDKSAGEIVGAYRIGKVDEILKELGKKWLYLSTSFRIKKGFFEKIQPALELSRAIVTQAYQRNFYSLFLLWAGIGKFLEQNPAYRYLIGSLSISADFHKASQNFMVHFLEEHYQLPGLIQYVAARHPFRRDRELIEKHYTAFNVTDLNRLQELVTQVEESDAKIPVLMRQYLKLGAKVVEFNVDPAFNNALDVLVVTDLQQAPVETMLKYMGADAYAHFRQEQGLPPLADTDA